jgi:hypothetical protein
MCLPSRRRAVLAHPVPLPPVSSKCKVCGPTSMLAISPFSNCRCFAPGGGATVDGARYDILVQVWAFVRSRHFSDVPQCLDELPLFVNSISA